MLNGKPELNDFFYNQILDTFLEDKEVLEAQQKFIDTKEKPPEVGINVDAGAHQARKILAGLIKAEANFFGSSEKPVSSS